MVFMLHRTPCSKNSHAIPCMQVGGLVRHMCLLEHTKTLPVPSQPAFRHQYLPEVRWGLLL
jgi:hypothetical protein